MKGNKVDHFDLGQYSKKVSTTSKEAQFWFDMGLNWCYGFNHEEGIKCFDKALEFDPDCVMAHWGAAYGIGPFYNNVWRQMSREEADAATRFGFDRLQQARDLADHASPLENDLVEAMARRFQQPNGVSEEEQDALMGTLNKILDNLDEPSDS